MTGALRLLQRGWLALALAALAVAQFVPIPALASGKPLALALSPSTVTLTEGQSATFALSKSGGNGRAVAVRVTTSDGSFSGSVAPGSSFTVPTRDDALVNGTRTIVVTATASTGATAKATITELDNDVAPAPAPAPVPAPPQTPVAVLPAPSAVKCADEGGTCSIVGTAFVFYGAGSAWLRLAATTAIACDNATFTDPAPGVSKSCVTDGQLAASTAPAPTPVPPSPAPAPAPAPSPTPVPLPPAPSSPLVAGTTVRVVWDELAAPKCVLMNGAAFTADPYPTVRAGDSVVLDSLVTDCGQPWANIWKVRSPTGAFLGFLFESNLQAAP